MSATSPTGRSLALLRRRGYLAEKVEQRLPRCHVTRDLFGVIDIVAVRPGEVAGVQTTSAANLSSRRSKVLASPMLRAWLESGARLYLHGWSLRGPRGRRKMWGCTEEELRLSDLDPLAEALAAPATSDGGAAAGDR